MTDPSSAPVKTYVSGTPARIGLYVDVKLAAAPPPPDEVEVPTLAISREGFDLDDYLVISGLPAAEPSSLVRMRSRVVVGDYLYSDAPPSPFDVDLRATCRWLPTDSSFTPDGVWTPSIGGGLVLQSDTPPYLDPSYSYSFRGTDEAELSAVIFDGDSAMRVGNTGWSTAAFGFVICAVMHENPEGPLYGIFESAQPVNPDDLTSLDSPYTDWGVRYRQGEILLHAGGTILSHQVQLSIGRPVVIMLSIDAGDGRLLVCDRTKSTRTFATSGFALYDIDFLLGQTDSGEPNETAYMDVLDLAYYDHGIDFADMADILHSLDAVYGVVG